ncbi:histone-lysine N-methyltransferase SETMAR [Trichonephila clavipes]|nr:histone-lysine N-methyltransferase SETMAR [Trichonephila clavipes]
MPDMVAAKECCYWKKKIPIAREKRSVKDCYLLRIETGDAPRSGKPVEADKDAIKALVDANQRITTREIGVRLNLSNSTVYDHLKGLGLSSKLDVWAPHVLTERNLCRRIDVCDSLLKRHENDPFLKRIITGDEKGHGAKKMNRLKLFPKPIFTKKSFDISGASSPSLSTKMKGGILSNPTRSMKIKHKPRALSTLATVGPIPRHLERIEAVACFRQTTGHDFWEYTFTGLAANESCLLCGHARMDGGHLLRCTGHDEYPTHDIASRHWEARRQMIKKPRMGVG